MDQTKVHKLECSQCLMELRSGRIITADEGFMKMFHDLLFTDYGLMSLAVIVFMLGMAVWFRAFFLRKMKESETDLTNDTKALP